MMYPFSSSDLICSVAVLKNYMENAPIKVNKFLRMLQHNKPYSSPQAGFPDASR